MAAAALTATLAFAHDAAVCSTAVELSGLEGRCDAEAPSPRNAVFAGGADRLPFDGLAEFTGLELVSWRFWASPSRKLRSAQ